METPELDEMDQLLRGRAARWRAGLPPAAPYRTTTATRPARGRHLPALAALATAAVLAVAWYAAPRGSTPSPVTPPDDSVVPWADLAPTDPALPTTSRAPSAEEIAAAPECGPGDLELLGRDMEGAAGTAYLSVRLGLVADHPCHLGGRVDVEPMGPDGEPLAIDVVTADSPEPVLVTAEAPVTVVVLWAVSHFCGDVDNATLLIDIPEIQTVRVEGFGASSCNPGEDHPPISVQALQPGYDESRHSPYENLTVTGDLDLTVQVDEPIEFQVTLLSPVDLPLVPCPDYEVLVGPRLDSYALNCSAVHHRDAQGRPYLPAGVPVTFAMRAEGFSPDVRIDKFAWQLVAPGHPGKGGVLTIGDPEAAPARLEGLVTMDGGPAPGTSIKVTEGEVHVVSADGGGFDLVVAIVGGEFGTDLPAGRYEVWASTPQWNEGARCGLVEDPEGNFKAGAEVVVDSGERLQVRISCPMR